MKTKPPLMHKRGRHRLEGFVHRQRPIGRGQRDHAGGERRPTRHRKERDAPREHGAARNRRGNRGTAF